MVSVDLNYAAWLSVKTPMMLTLTGAAAEEYNAYIVFEKHTNKSDQLWMFSF